VKVEEGQPRKEGGKTGKEKERKKDKARKGVKREWRKEEREGTNGRKKTWKKAIKWYKFRRKQGKQVREGN
jgi:hypothetical protein